MDEKTWLEAILRKNNYEDSALRIVEMGTCEDLQVGDNFLSQVRRLRTKVITGSGEHKWVSVIVKDQTNSERIKKISLEYGAFLREITMFERVLPKMEQLLVEIGDTEDCIWGKCYDIRHYDRLVLEDLTAMGYKMTNKKDQQGLESSLLVMKQFGKYHALSRILLQRSEIPMDILGHHVFDKIEDDTTNRFTETFSKLVEVMKNWGDEWLEARERLTKAIPNIGKNYIKALKYDASEFTVLNHGDCWTNNVLFYFEEDSQKPKFLKFIDFQLSFVGTPAQDVLSFITTSVQLDVQLQNMDLLLQTYCDSLKSYLLKFNYSDFIPDLEALKEIIEEKTILRLADAVLIAPDDLGDHENNLTKEEMDKLKAEALERGEKVPELWHPLERLNDKTLQIVQYAIKQAMEMSVI